MCTLFHDDDAGYRQWISTHPDGFVLNSMNRPGRNVIVTIHSAACYTIPSAWPAAARGRRPSTSRPVQTWWVRWMCGLANDGAEKTSRSSTAGIANGSIGW